MIPLVRYDTAVEVSAGGSRVSHAVVSSAGAGGATAGGVGSEVPASGSGGCVEPYRKRLRRRAADREVEGRSSGQLAALAVSQATSAVTSRRCTAGEAASCPPSDPASPASDGARTSACCDPADSDASPVKRIRFVYNNIFFYNNISL